MDALEEMRDAIARYHSWQFKSDMADGNDEGDPVDAAVAYEGTERAKGDIKLFALASIAESLATVADILKENNTQDGILITSSDPV